MVEEEHELELENALFANVLQDEMDMIEMNLEEIESLCTPNAHTSSNQSASNAGLSLAALTKIYLG